MNRQRIVLLVVTSAAIAFWALGGLNLEGETPMEPGSVATAPSEQGPADYTPDVSFTLHTDIAEGQLVFVGVGGDIDEVVNPTLRVAQNAVVQITLINGDGALHDLSIPQFNATSDRITGKGSSTATVFRASQEGTFDYFCTVPGHRAAGMEGQLVVGASEEMAAPAEVSIARTPTDLPSPNGEREPQIVRIHLEAAEIEGRLADGTTYTYWTFNGRVPGPFIRVRVGDTVEVRFTNRGDSTMPHSVDFHAVTGPGGGAVLTQTPPGEERIFTFKALDPGLYVYHCATPMVAQHIANGMYGLILVEPEGGLPDVDREF